MSRPPLLTKSSTKRVIAAALAEAIARNAWSHSDAGDAMDCSEGTIRNRLDSEDAKNQMTVHELRRITASDGAAVANLILADTGYRLVPIATGDTPPQPLLVGATLARVAGDLITAAADGVDAAEASELLPQVVRLKAVLLGLANQFRGIIAAAHPQP